MNINWEGNNISVGFQPVPPQLIETNSSQVEVGPIQANSPEIETAEFGPRLDTNSTEFNFKNELDWLPFQLNIRKEAKFMWDQQSHFINLVSDNKKVFSLHDEDLEYWDLIKHTILTTTDKPVYLLHHTIPRQLQGKCSNVWIPGCARPLLDHPKAHMHST